MESPARGRAFVVRAFARQRLILHCGLQINSSGALKRAAMRGGG